MEGGDEGGNAHIVYAGQGSLSGGNLSDRPNISIHDEVKRETRRTAQPS